MKVLFLCLGNSCRSIMAESMARVLGDGVVEPLSAGLSPAGFVADDTLDTLAGLGYPTDGFASKGLDAVPLEEVELIVSLLGDTGLRVVPSHVVPGRESWDVADPFGEDEAVYRSVAKEIERRVRRLVSHLDRKEPGLGG